MQLVGNFVLAVMSFAVDQFKTNPAEWTTAALLLLTLAFSIFLVWAGRKKMKFSFYQSQHHDFLVFLATNASASRQIRIARLGYRTWKGEEWSEEREIILEAGAQHDQMLTYWNDDKYMPMDESRKIYYLFTVDTTGHLYKGYTYWRPISWAVRFRYLLF
ncbi:hypothetical protein HY417_00610 [Candidatus Kaiserbacteria bacterium]|nr:hypothetical protein [Candidatus Kaiserbacteria bacterium]